MNNYSKDYNYNVNGQTAIDSVEATAASAYRNMYAWMAGALGLSALTSFYVMQQVMQSDTFAEIFLSRGMMWGLVIASIAMVMVIGGMIHRLSFVTASVLFTLYAVIVGAWISPVLLIYTHESVFQVFLITAGTFAGMSIYGHITKKDLTKIGQICGMAIWGLILASLVNYFMHSDTMSYIVSYVGVLIFCGLTMYDVQKMKNLIYEGGFTGEQLNKVALLGALNLYLDFINLFLYLLRILGRRK